jgi:hypothetical protein
MLKTGFKIFTYLVLLLVIGFLVKPMPDFPHHTPIKLPWQIQDTNLAQTNYQYLDNGQILITITHLPLIDITPKMLTWFYKNLPISTVQIGQEIFPWYQIFHPSEHQSINILQPTTDGSSGLGVAVGALIEKKQWFRSYNSLTTERVMAFSEQGMTLKPELAGLSFAQVEHLFIKTKTGTQYQVSSLIGSDLPIIGPVINLIIRYKILPEDMLKQWIRHQVEEVSNLNAFLPKLYQADKQGTHYLLTQD